jgi:hypothetical protein
MLEGVKVLPRYLSRVGQGRRCQDDQGYMVRGESLVDQGSKSLSSVQVVCIVQQAKDRGKDKKEV